MSYCRTQELFSVGILSPLDCAQGSSAKHLVQSVAPFNPDSLTNEVVDFPIGLDQGAYEV